MHIDTIYFCHILEDYIGVKELKPLQYFSKGILLEPNYWLYQDDERSHAIFGLLLCEGYAPNKKQLIEPREKYRLPIGVDRPNGVLSMESIVFTFDPDRLSIDIHNRTLSIVTRR